MKTIQATLRNIFGRQANKKFRSLNKIPAVIYSKHYIHNIHILIEESLLVNIIDDTKIYKILISLFNNAVEKSIIVKIQDIQFHPYKNKLLHIDFLHIKN